MIGDITGIVAIVIFWTFIAVCVIVGAWKRKKIEALRHETARLLIEKNPAVDSATLAQVINPLSPEIEKGFAYRNLKIAGTIVIALGLGLCVMGLCFAFITGDRTALGLSGPAALLMILGAGMLFAARFMPRPPAKDTETESYKSPKSGSEL